MPESFQTEVDRHWAGWGRRVTWRKMEEKKKKHLWPEQKSWNDVNWALSPIVILLQFPFQLLGTTYFPGSCGNLGNEGEEATRQGKLPSTNQSKALAWKDQEKGEESGGEGAGGLKIDSALPETNGHLPFGGQERSLHQRPELRRQKSGRFQSLLPLRKECLTLDPQLPGKRIQKSRPGKQ